MKKFVLTICVVIICMVTALFYGKTGIKTTTGVHDPDIALSENTAMEIFYTGGQKTSSLTMKVISHWMIWKKILL